MRVLLVSWASFVHGEATAGDVLAVQAVAESLSAQSIPYDTCWSPDFRRGALTLDAVRPDAYSHVVFVCGPLHGRQLEWLHERFARCRRIAVGVSVVDDHDPAVTGFDVVLPRDGGQVSQPDLSLAADTRDLPVIALIRAPGQREYGSARRHGEVHAALDAVLAQHDYAHVDIDTRLGEDEGAQFRTPDELCAVLGRVDLVVSTRLHGLVLGLRAGVPVLAVDPIDGGAKVSAQAAALGWPALVSADSICDGSAEFERWWRWCLSAAGRAAAQRCASRTSDDLRAALLNVLTA